MTDDYRTDDYQTQLFLLLTNSWSLNFLFLVDLLLLRKLPWNISVKVSGHGCCFVFVSSILFFDYKTVNHN